MNKKINVAVVGATGTVGRMMLKVLEERNFPIANLILLASKKSVGTLIKFKDKEYEVKELDENSFSNGNIELALFSVGGSISEKYAPIAAQNGVIVVDNSSRWRMEKNIPLILPEVNINDYKKYNSKIIANPNCSTIQTALPLKALNEKYGLKRIVYSTYQAVSGSGVKGIEDLKNGI